MAKKILVVRTSSLGDLIHMLPAISDMAHYVPHSQIDWIVEEAFAEIPGWHSAVREVIPVAHRRWRKTWWSPQTRQERAALRQQLAAQSYDMVLDMQGLMKSVWLVRQTHGQRHGLDRKSAREPLASFFYHVKHRVEFWQPAVIRQRLLASLALGYRYEGPPNFGLQAFTQGVETQPYVVIMPSASRDDKLWPSDARQQVLQALEARNLGLKVLAGNAAQAQRAQALVQALQQVFQELEARSLGLKVLTGNAAEEPRAQALVQALPQAEVLPRMALTEVAQVLARATLMVGLDSGLTDLSAALGRPTIGLYIASTPVRTPLQGDAYTASLGERDQPPSVETVLAAIHQALSLPGSRGLS